MHKILKGDDIVVIAGKDKGKRGTVQLVTPSGYVLVQNVNVVKKHVKPNPAKGLSGGIVSVEKPIHVSNVALFNPNSQKADRVGFKILERGQKVRFFKSDHAQVGG